MYEVQLLLGHFIYHWLDQIWNFVTTCKIATVDSVQRKFLQYINFKLGISPNVIFEDPEEC